MIEKQDVATVSAEQKNAATGDDAHGEALDLLKDPARRLFFKRAAVGGGGALLGGAGAYGATKVSLKGRLAPDYPVIDINVFKPKDQRDVILNFVSSKTLNDKHPERNEQYNRLQNKEFNWVNGIKDMYSKPWDNSKPGYTQMDRALQKAGWEPLVVAGSRLVANLQPNTPLHAWDQSDVIEEQYQFESKKQASDAIKSAARVFGAVKCGIARRDKRWDYDPLYDIENEKELSWEKDFPFEPKTVIVMLSSMDYDCMATAPAWTADGTAADDVAPAEDGFGSRRMGLVGDEFIPWNLMIPDPSSLFSVSIS